MSDEQRFWEAVFLANPKFPVDKRAEIADKALDAWRIRFGELWDVTNVASESNR